MNYRHCQANMLFLLIYLISMSQAARHACLFPP